MGHCLERTCRCINDFVILPDNRHSNEKELNFHKGREYQVDIYVLFFKVYQNGGYDDYAFLSNEEFDDYFELIK